MKKLTTKMMQQTLNKQDGRLTIGLDLGDRSSFYCVLDEAGDVLMEQRLSTTPRAIKEIFGAMPRSRIALETGTHSPWEAGCSASSVMRRSWRTRAACD
jgi:transposase